VLSARNPVPFLPVLRRLVGLGFPILFIAFGPGAEDHAALARRAGVASRTATLDGPWRTADQLVVAG